MPGISTGETEFINAFPVNPVVAGIAVDFIGYERQFCRDIATLLAILEMITGSQPALTSGLIRPLHGISLTHRPFLDRIEKILRHHRPTWVAEFVALFTQADDLFSAHRTYMLQLLAVEGFINNFSPNCPPDIQAKLNGRLMIHFFKCPIAWQKYVSTVAADLIRYLPPDCDRALKDRLIDFRRRDDDLSASIDSIPKLEQISKLFLREPFPTAVSGRRFIRQGRAMKQCRKAVTERELLLFSDIFMYVQPKGGKYMVPASYQLAFLRVVPETANGIHCLYVYAPSKSFIVQFQSEDERDSWNLTIQDAIVNARAQVRIPRYREAPIWIPDIMSNECMQCHIQLTFFRRKHHCRNCGLILCSSCLSKRMALKHISETSLSKICVRCYEQLTVEQMVPEVEKAVEEDEERNDLVMHSVLAEESDSDSDTSGASSDEAEKANA
jgi:hypothetical protein